MRILIVSYYFPPLNAIGAHRPYWWARHFEEMGAEVTVLTCQKSNFDGPQDLDLPALNTTRVIEIDYLSTSGRFISMLSKLPIWGALKLIYRNLQRLKPRMASGADPRSAWLSACLGYIQKSANDFDFVISSFSPKESHLIAWEVKKINPGITWIADYRDHWSLPQGERQTITQPLAFQKIEQDSVGKDADLIMSISEEFTNQISSFLSKPGIVSHNGHDVLEADVIENVARYRERALPEKTHIIHTGTVYADTRNPAPLFSALELLSKDGGRFQNDFRVKFIGRNLDGLAELRTRKSSQDLFEEVGPVSRDKAMQLQADADILLLLSGSMSIDKGVLTGKVFEYITAGVPILAVGSSQDSAIGRLLRETRTGVAVGTDVQRILSFLQDIRTIGPKGYFDPDITAIMRYHRRVQSDIVWRWLVEMQNRNSGRNQ